MSPALLLCPVLRYARQGNLNFDTINNNNNNNQGIVGRESSVNIGRIRMKEKKIIQEQERRKKEKRKHKKYMIRMILEAEMVC